MNSTNLANRPESVDVKQNEPDEIKFLHEQFPMLSREELVKATELAGPFRRDILEFIQRIHGYSN